MVILLSLGAAATLCSFLLACIDDPDDEREVFINAPTPHQDWDNLPHIVLNAIMILVLIIWGASVVWN